MRPLPALLLLAAVSALALPPPALAGSQASDTTQTSCFGALPPVTNGLFACATGDVNQTLDCGASDATHVTCWANLTWVAQGGNPLGVGPTGSLVRAGGATLAWNNFQYGVGLLVTTCAFGRATPCGNTTSYAMYTGPIAVDAGACLTVHLDGWITATTYAAPPSVFGNPTAQVYVDAPLEDTVCP
jgi:hypothetical protein